MSVLVKEAVELIGSTYVGELGAISISEMAAWLYNRQGFATLERAFEVARTSGQYWYEDAMYAINAETKAIHLRVASGGAAEAVTSTTETALEVAQSSSLTATNTELSTGVVTVADTSGGAGTSFGFKALLGMDVGIMAAAVAPVLGVSLGANLYESNPELWTKISQAVLPFCYEDSTMAPVWAGIDALGNWEISVANDIVEAIRSVFIEEGVGTFPNNDVDPTTAPGITDPLTWVEVKAGDVNPLGDRLVRLDGSNIPVRVARFGDTTISAATDYTELRWYNPSEQGYEDSYRTGNTYTKDGLSVSYGVSNVGRNTISILYESAAQTGIAVGLIAWYLLYGTSTVISGYPAGTSKWGGTTPSSVPHTDPIIDEDGNPIDMTPISPPLDIPSTWQPGLPAPSGNPTDQPDPTITVDPDKQIAPYISATPTPRETIYPIPASPPDPGTNPSTPIPPKTTLIDAVPLPPNPGGESPIAPMPTTSTPFASNVGLVTVYHPDDAELYAFESWLWVTYADATIDKIWNNPFDGVITLFELYCTPTDIGNRNIHCGFLDSGVNSPIISRYTEIDCGTLGIPEWYGNYLDYSPYTKAHIYLPFIGIQELNPDDIVGHGVNVTYRIDEYNGSCIAMITVAKSTEVNGETVDYSNTMYQFSGNCAVELPITGGSQAAIKAGMMQADAYQTAAMVSVGTNIMGGLASVGMGSVMGAVSGAAGAANAAAYGQANYLSNMLSGKSTVQKSGSFGASHGALGIKQPFITITRPKQIQVANYEKLYGFPAHKMVTIGACTGFLRCREVNVVSATANDEEKALIEQLLKTGVYVTE